MSDVASLWEREIPQLVAQVAQALQQQRALVTTAESCTGGLIAAALTRQAGSSLWFHGGVVAYDNTIKRDCLGVPDEILRVQGAVSEPVVAAMALGAASLMRSDWAIAVSGIAGPGGATPGKPVGTVCFGLAHCPAGVPTGTWTKTLRLPGDRDAVRLATVATALSWLLDRLALVSASA